MPRTVEQLSAVWIDGEKLEVSQIKTRPTLGTLTLFHHVPSHLVSCPKRATMKNPRKYSLVVAQLDGTPAARVVGVRAPGRSYSHTVPERDSLSMRGEGLTRANHTQ